MTKEDRDFDEFIRDRFGSKLANKKDEIDAYGQVVSVKPRPENIEKAKFFVCDMRRLVLQEGLEWIRPHIDSDEQGYVLIEWYGGDIGRSLYLTVYENNIGYNRLWRDGIKRIARGSRIGTFTHTSLSIIDRLKGDRPMAQLTCIFNIITLWKWFVNGGDFDDPPDTDDLAGELEGN